MLRDSTSIIQSPPVPPPTVLVIGAPPDVAPLMAQLPLSADYRVIALAQADLDTLLPQLAVRVALVVYTPDSRVSDITALLRQHRVGWVAWLPDGAEMQADGAWHAGALTVVLAQTGAAMVQQVIRNAIANLTPQPSLFASYVTRRYALGDFIELHESHVVTVEVGVAALSVLHDDGTEVLLGLFGAGNILLGHSEDSCHIQCVAHTDVAVVRHTWAEVGRDPQFANRLRTRLLHMEAWAAAQAYPFLDQRVLGILMLLAEDFGVAHEHGTLIDVRVTHLHLASAVGANRSSITRTLSELRERGLVLSVGRGKAERLCLSHRTHQHHSFVAAPERRLMLHIV